MAVLTDFALLQLLKSGENRIELPEKTLITPSAWERIRAKKIEIVYLSPGGKTAPLAKEKPWEKLKSTSSSTENNPKKYVFQNTGGYFAEKPEHMTALRGNELVFKNHPRIVFRGALDTLISALLLLMRRAHDQGKKSLVADLDTIKAFLYHMQLCEVSGSPLEPLELVGLSDALLREHSHYPKKYYGVDHLFQMDYTTDKDALEVNVLRCTSRELEILAFNAYFDGAVHQREDIARALNRLSSGFYIIELKATSGAYHA